VVSTIAVQRTGTAVRSKKAASRGRLSAPAIASTRDWRASRGSAARRPSSASAGSGRASHVIASSACIEIARRSLRGRREHRFELWWKVTMGLGISFLVAQMCAWFQLVRNGFYVNTNRHSGFAYIFTVLHAVHLLGGIAALSFVYLKSRRGLWTAVRRRSSVDATAIYWHFLTGLWIYILLILFIWTL